MPFFVGGLIFLFYIYFQPTVAYISKPGINTILSEPFSIGTLKTRFIIIIEKLIQGIFFYSPYLLIFIVLVWTNLKNIRSKFLEGNYLILSCLILIGIPISTIIWQLLYYSFGASQFLFYTMLPFINITSGLLLFYAIMQLNKTRYMFFGMYFLLTFFYIYRSYSIYAQGKTIHHDKYSKEYIAKVLAEVAKLDLKYGLKIEDKSTIIKFNDSHHLVGEFLSGHFNDVFMCSYSKANMFLHNEFPSEEAKMLLPKAPLVNYIKHKHKFFDEKILQEEVEKLILDGKLNFIIMNKNSSLPLYLFKYIKKSFSDNYSREIFFVLKK